MLTKNLLLAALTALLFACTNKDCSTIDLTKLSDIKLEESIKTSALKLEEFPIELNVHLNKNHKLILRCRTEADFLNDRVLPGLMLWISDSWQLRNDTSKLGRIFYRHKIDPWERTRVAGVLYHRYITDVPLEVDSLLADASVRSAYAGRIVNEKALLQFNDAQKKTLLSLIAQSDSLLKVVSLKEISLPRTERLKKKTEKLINSKNLTLQSLDIIERSYQNKISFEKDIELLSDSVSKVNFAAFNTLSFGDKTLFIEKERIELLKREVLGL